jgi:membrane protease YdiL (CAAX protease family)
MFITPKSQNYTLIPDFPSGVPILDHMSNKIRIYSPWSQLLVFIGMWLASLVIFNFLAILVFQLSGSGNQLGQKILLTDVKSIDTLKIVQVLYSVVQFATPAIVFARIAFWKSTAYELGLRPAADKSFYLLGVLLLILSFPLQEWLGEVNKHIPLAKWMIEAGEANEEQVGTFLKVHHPFDPVINVVVMAAIPAICEELFFGGALQRIMIQIFKRPLPGILVVAFLFSFYHFEFEGFIPRLFLGALLGATYWYSGSLWVVIVGHFFFNAVQIIVAMSYPSMISKDTSVPLLLVAFSFAIVAGLLYWMRSRSTSSYTTGYQS